MKTIDKNNFVYLNTKPKLKFVLYALIFTILIGFSIASYSLYLKKSCSNLGVITNPNESIVSINAPADFRSRYIEGYYFINGIDPSDVIKGNTPPDKYNITYGGGSAPFAILIHLLINPPFLPPSIALWIYLGCLIGCWAISSFIIYKFASQRVNICLSLLCVLFFIAQKYTFLPIILGNYATITFAVIIGLAFTNFFEKHPIIGGIIMGIAMVKAQMMVLMFIPFLMQKRFLSVGISVAFVLISLCIVAFHVDKSPIILLQEYFDFGTSAGMYLRKNGPYMGIFTDFFNLQLELRTLLGRISMVFFFILSCVIIYIYRHKNKIFLYTFLSIISAIWGYNYSATTLGMIYTFLSILALLSLAKTEKFDIIKTAIYSCLFLCMFFHFPKMIFGNDFYPFLPHQETLIRLYMLFTFLYLIYDYNKNKYLMKYID